MHECFCVPCQVTGLSWILNQALRRLDFPEPQNPLPVLYIKSGINLKLFQTVVS